MKVSYSNDEIIVDLTQSRIKNSDGDKEIVISKTNFLIPVNKGIPKTFAYYNRNKINSYYLNCTCKDYRASIKLYPLRDIRRICKHIFFILIQDHSERIDGLIKLLLEHRFWDKVADVYEIFILDEKLYISFGQEMKFIHVYIKKSDWKFYTYFPWEKVWKNDLPPFKISDLNSKLSQFLLNIFLNNLKSNKNYNIKTA
jgi:hypothetical protein